MRLPGLIFAGLQLIVAATHARADIVFVDLNFSSDEVRNARNAAARRRPPERLVVIPNLTPAERSQIDSITASIYSKKALITRINAQIQDGRLSRDEVTVLRRRLTELPREIQALKESVTPIVGARPPIRAQLAAAIQQIERSGRTVSSPIFSAHSNGQRYWGLAHQSISVEEIRSTFRQFPRSQAAVRSLFLFGCYSTTQTTAPRWLDIFPSARVILGFEGSAPSGHSGVSGTLLGNALIQEEAFALLEDEDRIRKAILTLPGIIEMNASAVVNRCLFSVPDRTIQHLGGQQDCLEILQRLQSERQVYRQFANAQEAEFRDPPTNPYASPLRNFYSYFQHNSHCIPAPAPGTPPEFPSTENILGLLFYPNVREMFAARYATQIDALNDHLTTTGAPTRLRISSTSLASLNRHGILRWIRGLEGQNLPDQFQPLLHQLQNMLRDLRDIPADWFEASNRQPETTQAPQTPQTPLAPRTSTR